MAIQVNPKTRYVVAILGIGCISSLVFLFYQVTSNLASQCLRETIANTSVGAVTICAQPVTTIDPWYTLHFMSAILVVVLPAISYYFVARSKVAVPRRIVQLIFTAAGIAGISTFVFLLNTYLYGHLASQWFSAVALPCVAYVLAKRTRGD